MNEVVIQVAAWMKLKNKVARPKQLLMISDFSSEMDRAVSPVHILQDCKRFRGRNNVQNY